MTNRVPASTYLASAWKIAEVEKLLASNHRNTLTYFDAAGVACIRQFPEVRRDTLAVIALLRKAGCPMEPGRRGAICGGPGYPWLLVAVACIMSGVEIVAAPELLTNDEMTASLDGLQLDFVASEKNTVPTNPLRHCRASSWAIYARPLPTSSRRTKRRARGHSASLLLLRAPHPVAS